MDTTAPDIRFDAQGICNYCTELLAIVRQHQAQQAGREAELERVVGGIKAAGKGKAYDCVLGVSGGLDSSYALFLARRLGLRPLAVHMDNGWNSELSVSNIERLVKALGVDLYTYVLDWHEFRDLQRAFFHAQVVDIELVTDNAIMASLRRVARRHRARHILLGQNVLSEGMPMPPGWNHLKADLRNIKAIYRRHGSGLPLRGVPLMGVLEHATTKYLRRVRQVFLLDYVRYDTREAREILQREVGWRPYERKHYESVFTRFYQGFILPVKFNVDKRKVHFSTLICSGQMTRDEALSLMEHGAYEDPELLRADREFVLKKLGFTESEFERYLHTAPVSHYAYPSIDPWLARWRPIKAALRRGWRALGRRGGSPGVRPART